MGYLIFDFQTRALSVSAGSAELGAKATGEFSGCLAVACPACRADLSVRSFLVLRSFSEGGSEDGSFYGYVKRITIDVTSFAPVSP